jgi:hypothetical protein
MATNSTVARSNAADRRSMRRCEGPPWIAEAGTFAGRTRDDHVDVKRYARLKTSVPFVPPNPNEFFSATSIFISRAVFAQ